ncbi:MAG: FAD-dependent oxidoreductase, partial [Candidatus Limnocylindria bacterium]
MSLPAHVDVLVIGAGPTGLMLAVQLARRSVRVLIVDRNPGPSVATKALGVQARTVEIYSRLGIAERALEAGTRASGANIWVEGRRAARVPLGDIGRDLSPYPFVLILGQDDNERLLGEALRDEGVEVHWNTDLVALVQSSGEVSVTLKRPDGSLQAIEAGWVAPTAPSLSSSDRWLGSVFRTRALARLLGFAMGREALRRLAFRTISQIGIHYRASPLFRRPCLTCRR